MNYICRRWTKSFIYFILLPSLVWAQNDVTLEALSGKIADAEWVVFNCKVVQAQGDDLWEDAITITSTGENFFQIEASDQIIQVRQDTIWTFLLNNHQITIDQYFKDVPNVFHFLTGNFGSLDIGKTEIKNGEKIISFNDIITGYSGNLVLDHETSIPKRLTILLDSTSKIKVHIKQFITGKTYPPEFFKGDDNWSVVDLRE